MDAPPIQYARSEDGVNIAYWTLGEGPLVIMPGHPFSHGQLEWAVPELAETYERLAADFTVLRYDPRGSGLSDRDYVDGSLAGHVGDLEAVIRDAALERYVVFSRSHLGPAAIRFARQADPRLAGLVLWHTHAEGAASSATPELQSALALARGNWGRAIDAMLRSWARISDESVAAWTRYLAESVTQEAFLRFFVDRADDDVRADLQELRIPALVVHRRTEPGGYPLDEARRISAGIPNARLFVSEAEGSEAFVGDEPERQVIGTFLHEVYASDDAMAPLGTPGFRTLLFTDLESSTALTQALGDAKAQDILNGHNQAVRAALDAHGGEEVKHTGDGIFAAFGSAVSAVEASLQIQRELAGAEVRVRIGLNAGEPIAEDGDYFGSAVQLAARVCDSAEPGQVLVSNVVKELCTGKLFQFEDQGEATLKGFPEPVRLFVVGEGE